MILEDVPLRHQLLAVAVATMWGLNFLAIDASLAHVPPFFLVALRFAVIAVPTLLWVPRPQVPLRWLVGYGLGFGTLQFLFLYWGMAVGMPAGLASLVLQASAPFTLVLGATLLGERVGRRGVVGVVLAAAGLAVVGWHRAEAASLLPFLLTLAGALGWAVGNVCSRQARPPRPLHLTLWMSVVPPLPMGLLALAVEGPERIATAMTTLATPSGLLALAGLAYTVLVGTVVASGTWTWLLARHPASQVAPFSMLVPVVGMSAAWALLGERVAPPELAGGVLVVGGVLLATLSGRGVVPAAAPAPPPPADPPARRAASPAPPTPLRR